MHHKVLIALAALFGIYRFIKIKHTLSRTIIAMQVAGIAMTFLPVPFVAGLSIFILAGIIACLYPFVQKDITGLKKGLILAIALPVTITNIFTAAHFPFVGMLGFAMIVPLAALVYIIAKQMKAFKNEIGFLVLFAADAFIKILMSVEWAWY